MTRKRKGGPPKIYPDDGPLSDHITIRVTPRQKDFIMDNLGTSDLRKVLIEYASRYNKQQLPLKYSNAGYIDLWRVNEP
jgi:hypothetical protein